MFVKPVAATGLAFIFSITSGGIASDVYDYNVGDSICSKLYHNVTLLDEYIISIKYNPLDNRENEKIAVRRENIYGNSKYKIFFHRLVEQYGIDERIFVLMRSGDSVNEDNFLNTFYSNPSEKYYDLDVNFGEERGSFNVLSGETVGRDGPVRFRLIRIDGKIYFEWREVTGKHSTNFGIIAPNKDGSVSELCNYEILSAH